MTVFETEIMIPVFTYDMSRQIYQCDTDLKMGYIHAKKVIAFSPDSISHGLSPLGMQIYLIDFRYYLIICQLRDVFCYCRNTISRILYNFRYYKITVVHNMLHNASGYHARYHILVLHI